MIQIITSGGQTGADRTALDWVIANCYPTWRLVPRWAAHRRWGGSRCVFACAKRAERSYPQRTKWNVRDSDATLIITPAAEFTGGSLFTQEWTRKIDRPCLHVYRCNEWREWIRIFFGTNSIAILNVAGRRGSGVAGIEQFVHEVLDEMLANSSAKKCACNIEPKITIK